MTRRSGGRQLLQRLFTLLILSTILAACGSGPSASTPSDTSTPDSSPAGAGVGGIAPGGKILRFAGRTWPDTLDPQDASFTQEFGALILNYEGLTRFDKDLHTVPAAAESWLYNRNATRVGFRLRAGLKYSDGSPLTATDFALAIKRLLDPRGFVGDYQDTLFMIRGAKELLDAGIAGQQDRIPGLIDALGIQTPDPRTIIFDLTQPTPYFHTLMALPLSFPAKDSLVKAGGETWWENPANHIGNGPFQFTRIDKVEKVVEFKANEYYWRGRPKLDGVRFQYIGDLSVAIQAYKKGELDVAVPDPSDLNTLRADPQLSKELVEYPGACTEVFELNLTKEPFNDPKVREAFAYAFDRESFIRDVLQGASLKTLTWIAPGIPGHDTSENRFDYDLNKAREALAQSRYGSADKLPEIKFSYNSNNPYNQPRVEYLIQMYRKNLGITNMIPDPLEGRVLVSARKDSATHPQINPGGWCSDYPDPQNWLSVYLHSRSEFAKNIGYKNETVDRLIDQADAEVDQTKRMALYDQAQKLTIGDVPQLLRSSSRNSYLIKPYVTGMDFTSQDWYLPGLQTGLLNVTLER